MKNLFFLMSFLLLFSFTIQAQNTAKPKVPKGLINTWVIDYSTYESIDYPTSHKNTIKITNKEVFIEGEALSYDADWSSTDTYQEDLNYTYTENPSNGQTDTTANNNGKHKIIHTLISKDKLSGKLVLEYRDPYSITYKVLIYNQLDKEKVNFFMKYNFYSPQQALEVAQKTPVNPPKSKTYFSNAKYGQMNQLPELTISNKEQYLAIWDAYIYKMQDDMIAQKLKEDGKTYKMPMLEGSYLTSSIRDGIFLEKGYNPAKSVENFQKAIQEYGYPEELKTKIRGAIDNAKFEQSKQMLINTWVNSSYMSQYGSQFQEFTLEISTNQVNILFKSEVLDDLNKVTKNSYTFKLPWITTIPMDDEKSGIMVLGPLPDSLDVNSGNEFVTLGFKILEDENIRFYFAGGAHESPEKASISYIDLNVFDQPFFISKASFDKFQLLPTALIYSLEDYKELKEKIDLEFVEDVNNPFSREEYLRKRFASQSLNPYESIKLMQSFESEMQLEESIKSQFESIESYESYLKDADPSDTVTIESYKTYIEDGKIYLEQYQLQKDIKVLTREGSNPEVLAQKTKKLNGIYNFNRIKNKINDVTYGKSSVEYAVNDVKYGMDYVPENPEEYNYYSYDYYKEYYENTLKNLPVSMQDSLNLINTELIQLKAQNDIVFADKIDVLYKKAQDTQKETEKMLPQVEALLKEWETKKASQDK